MRSLLTVFALAAMTAACGGSGSTPAPATAGTILGGTSTAAPAGATSPAEQANGQTVTVVLTGGGAPGTYTGTGDPHCSFGLVPGAWGTQFSVADATAGQLSSVQLVDPTTPASAGGVTLLVTVGPLLGGVNYDVNPISGGSGTATVNDSGSSAVIHATGTTSDGTKIDATINCPSVTRAGS